MLRKNFQTLHSSATQDETAAMEKQRKGGKSKNKKDSLPYFAKINSSYQKHTFKTKLEDAFKNKKSVEDGEFD